MPPRTDPKSLQGLGALGQCASDDLRVIDDCRFQTFVEWTELPNRGMQARVPLVSCGDPRGCYFAFQEGDKGYPEIAKTERFQVLP